MHPTSRDTTPDGTAAAASSAGRTGYDPGFLGVALPLPSAPLDPVGLALLPYVHFTVLLDRERKLARLTAVNIEGASLIDLGRGDDWHLDERVPADEQTGPEVYARNDLDRGHLVRRRDPVWGPDAARANTDTFSYANAAPQVNVFNQSKELWLGLEDYVLAYADSADQRLSVFTGPVFSDSDPEYRGTRIPKRFWKIAAWVAADGLAATAYLLDQGDLLDALDLPTARAAQAPPELGPFRTFQLPVGEIAALTGLDLAELEKADRFRPRPGVLPTEWTPILSEADIRL